MGAKLYKNHFLASVDSGKNILMSQGFLAIRRIGMSAVFWGGASTVIRTFGFLFVTAYALRQLPSREMGLWQVLFTLIGFATVVEMGFSFTVGRFVSYFMGGARTIPRKGFALDRNHGSEPNYEGILGLIVLARRLYSILGFLTVGLALAGWQGWCIWTRHASSWSEWSLISVYAVGTGVNMAGMYWTGMLFGLNRVRDWQLIQLVGFAVSYIVSAIGLHEGWGIWALVSGQLIMTAVPRWWARKIVRDHLPRGPYLLQRMSFIDVWSITWRTGFVTVGGYLMYQATALTFSLWAGLERMASFGLTLQAVLLVRAMGDMWILVKLPLIGSDFARGDVVGVKKVFVERSICAGLTYLVGLSGLMLCGPFFIELLGSHTPLMDRSMILLIGVIIGLDMLPGLHSALLLNANTAPHGVWYLVSGCVSISLGVTVGWIGDGRGVLLAPLLCSLAWVFWRVPFEAWKMLRGIRAERLHEGG